MPLINSLYLPELRELLAERDAAGLREFCQALHPVRTAEFMEGLTADEAWQVLRHADSQTQAEIFNFFDREKQLEILQTANRREIGQLIAELPSDDRVDLLKEADPLLAAELLPLVPAKARRDILRLQAYPEGTAGAVMTSDFGKLPATLNVRQAIDEIARQAESLETIYYIYIVDDDNHLLGLVSARQLLSTLARPNTTMEELMERDLITVNANDDQEKMAAKVARFDVLAIPVVDEEHHLLGIITHDDVIDVLREEATEDAHRLSAVDPLERGYLETHWLTLTWKRGIWLVILFFGGLLTAFALQNYEGYLAQISWLVLFIPLVLSCGGNSGSQSATLVITAMTTGDVRLRDWGRVLLREILVGALLGCGLGAIGYVVALLVTGDALSSTVIPLTILCVVISGTLVGSLLPMVFRRLGLDPALMSNPFVSGISDIVGIVIYMNIALALLAAFDF